VRGLTILMAMLVMSSTQAANNTFSLSTGLDYSVGNYGETQDTETWFLPVNLKFKRDHYTFKLGTSYIWMRGPLNVTPEGEPLTGSGVTKMVHGAGDVTASLAANLLDEEQAALELDLVGKIKFGTADTSKALGTGENDYSLQASLYKTLGAWGPYLELGHRWKGDPAGVNYRNVWYGTMGASYRFSKLWSVGADYSWRDKLIATSEPVSEATVYANYRINNNNRLNFYGTAGFSDTSADWGIGLTATRLF